MLDSGKFAASDTSRAVKTIYRNAKSQAKLIEDILDVSRIITGKLRIETKPTTLAPILQSAVETLRPTIEAKNIRCKCVSISRPSRFSQTRIECCRFFGISSLTQLNSRRKNGRVDVELINEARQIKIIVSDNGKGIEPEFLPFVFDRFRQADGTARALTAVWVGLSIVRHVVELHGGTVEVASQGPVGHDFYGRSADLHGCERRCENIENKAEKEITSIQEMSEQRLFVRFRKASRRSAGAFNRRRKRRPGNARGDAFANRSRNQAANERDGRSRNRRRMDSAGHRFRHSYAGYGRIRFYRKTKSFAARKRRRSAGYRFDGLRRSERGKSSFGERFQMYLPKPVNSTNYWLR
jgi:hypothetical protein